MRTTYRTALAAVLFGSIWLMIVLAATDAALSRPGAAVGDVVINEVAWMGTSASLSDEWIELYNTTDAPIDLSGWRLTALDGSPDISLSGVISAHGYFLLERSDDSTVADIPADQIFSGSLGNSDDGLRLYDGDGRLIDSANGDGGDWPAGDNASKAAMERIDPAGADEADNWATNDGVHRNGIDADGSPINGTPKARNSAACGAQPTCNLAVSKRGPVTATAGATITYRLMVSNTGLITAEGVVLTDVLPAALDFITATPAPHLDGPLLTWTWASMTTGTAEIITLTARLDAGFVGRLTNRLTATSATTESDSTDNSAAWTTRNLPVLIDAVLYDGYASGDLDEAVRLVNLGRSPITLTGWSLCKWNNGPASCAALPALSLPARGGLWIAREASAFAASFGFEANVVPDSWPGFANGGDEVLLLDDDDEVIDTLVFGNGTIAVPGWQGAAITPAAIGREEGQIITRIPDEQSGLPAADSDSADDWLQTPNDAEEGRRVRYPGWDMEPLFWPLSATTPATVIVGIAPDNAFTVVSQTLVRARRTISLESYTLRHPLVISTLITKATEGVSVTVLLEGGPVGLADDDPRWQQELAACKLLEAAGGRCYFMIHDPDEGIFNRYAYLHAKLLIVDGEWLLVSSQNFTNSSMPADEKSDGTYGSRGVVIATNAVSVVQRAARLFALDCDPVHHNDILRWNSDPSDPRYGEPRLPMDWSVPDGTTYTVRISRPLVVSGTVGFELFSAPEAALRHSDALLGLIARAGEGDLVEVEQMYEAANWDNDDGPAPNLRLEAYVAAARRGARVRILLNNGTFGQDYAATAYTETVAAINALAAAEGLDMQAAAADPTRYGIHNKMVLVHLHDGGYVHIGSINGSEASSKLNREVALQLHDEAVYAYLHELFRGDWQYGQPLYLPLVMHRYIPPADHLLISEVYYATSDPNREWVELYNPTAQAIDLGGYRLGDAEGADRYEGMYIFPAGTTLPPHGVMLIAYNGAVMPQADFEIEESSVVPNLTKDPLWGRGDWILANGGDQVLLLDAAYRPVDVVVWGTATYPAVVAHPGVSYYTHSLERHPPEIDTDDCSRDFRDRAAPTPGDVFP